MGSVDAVGSGGVSLPSGGGVLFAADAGASVGCSDLPESGNDIQRHVNRRASRLGERSFMNFL